MSEQSPPAIINPVLPEPLSCALAWLELERSGIPSRRSGLGKILRMTEAQANHLTTKALLETAMMPNPPELPPGSARFIQLWQDNLDRNMPYMIYEEQFEHLGTLVGAKTSEETARRLVEYGHLVPPSIAGGINLSRNELVTYGLKSRGWSRDQLSTITPVGTLQRIDTHVLLASQTHDTVTATFRLFGQGLLKADHDLIDIARQT